MLENILEKGKRSGEKYTKRSGGGKNNLRKFDSIQEQLEC